MNFVVDMHTHSISSGHSYSTIQEMAKYASEIGLKAFAVTDHGPSMTGAPTSFHFNCLRRIPEEIFGVRVIKGAEINIISYDGELDLPQKSLERIEFGLASLHDVCLEPSTLEENTKAMISAIKNPYIDAIAHPENPVFPVDIEQVVMAAKKYQKLLEVNCSSPIARPGGENDCKKIMSECKKQGVRMFCGTDAHISFEMGQFDYAYRLFEEVGFPEELIINTSMERLEGFLKEREERLK